jgi:hypothetical protein
MEKRMRKPLIALVMTFHLTTTAYAASSSDEERWEAMGAYVSAYQALDAFGQSICGDIIDVRNRNAKLGDTAIREIGPYVPAGSHDEAATIFAESASETKGMVDVLIRRFVTGPQRLADRKFACGAVFGLVSAEIAKAKARWLAVQKP